MTQNKTSISEFMNQQYLCETLTVREVETLLEFTEQATYDKGAAIAEVGEVGEALFFVIHGKAKLLHIKGDNRIDMGSINAGEMMGEMSFFDRKPRLLSIVAGTDDTRLLKLTRAMYKRLRVEHPYIAVNLLEHAIISLDSLFREMSSSGANLTHYIFGKGKR